MDGPFGAWINLSLLILLLVGLSLAGCTPAEPVWHEEPGYRWAELRVRSGSAGFERLSPAATGVTFVNHLTEDQIVENRHRMHGSGVAVGDVDGDGRADIYLAGLDGPNVLYRNRGGMKFEDVTEAAGVAASGRFSTGALLEDIDGDRDLDLLVTAMGGPNAAYLNDGAGIFEEATAELNLASNRGSTSMALADVEGDGDLDLYIANYKRTALRDSLPPDEIAWERVVRQEEDRYFIDPKFESHYALEVHGTKLLRLESAEPDAFFLKEDDEGYVPVQNASFTLLDEAGQLLHPNSLKDWALTARFQDLNGDGAPDLYVCNDFESPDYIWMNAKDQGFQAIPSLAIRKTSNATMSIAVSDIDRDGFVDFFLADMLSTDYKRRSTQRGTQAPLPVVVGEIENRPQVMQNTLFRNRGDGTFAEIAFLGGVQASDWTWSSAFLDVDLDGYEDLLITNGHAFDVQNSDAQAMERRRMGSVRRFGDFRRLILDFPPLDLKNIVFRNEGNLRFTAQPNGWGLGDEPDVSHGMALGDLDNDGDLDVVINRLNRVAGVYRNKGSAPRVAVRLRGHAGNTRGIGAKIRLRGGPVPFQEKEAIAGGAYLSGSDPVYSFATGDRQEGLAIEVAWRSGRVSRIEEVKPNRIYEIDEAGASPVPMQPTAEAAEDAPFQEVAIDYKHEEAVFDDYARQPLLPRRLSQAGPAVAWADVDRDGDDDLLVGSGRGGRAGFFRNDGPGGLLRDRAGAFDREAKLDQAGLIAIPQGNGTRVLVAESNYEAAAGVASRILVYAVEYGSWQQVQELDFGASGVGPLASADIDGDGDLDLFAGGMVVPGRYPEAPSSRIYLNDGQGRFAYDDALSDVFAGIGMVRGAVFGDIDGDRDQDLALAVEWGALRLMENDGSGRFSDVSEARGLNAYTGLWQGVELGDFNGDGRLDIVATNWGWNSLFGRPQAPIRLYWGDFDGNGVMDVLESHYEPSMGGYVPEAGLNLLWYSLPYLRRQITSFKAFSEMTLEQVIGDRIRQGAYLEAGELANLVLLNEGEQFQGRALPVLAQVAPAFGVAIGDFDNDGAEDAFMAQNFFAERLEVARNDAGRGLWIRGDGAGRFVIAEGTVTGIKVYGEQRGAGLSDFDRDGRVDVAVSQNGRELKLYRNRGARPGIRIRLDGPAGNAWGIGSRVRLVYADGSMGPTRNVAAGSGYWGQRSAVQVLGIADGKQAAAVQVIWPDGREQEVSIGEGAADVVISYD